MQLWEHAAIEGPERARRRVRNGQPTNELAFSAYVGGNEDTFPHILDLYVAPGSRVADVTFGKGVFWRNVPEERYELLATDIQTGVDCRDLPYENGTIDCVVLDPALYALTGRNCAYCTHGIRATLSQQRHRESNHQEISRSRH